MHRRVFLVALAAYLSVASGLEAQVHPGLHVARAADSFDGVDGVGGSVEVTVPDLPVVFSVAAEYFFPSCDDCSLWGGSADVHFSLPIRVVTPYGTAGLVMRNTDASDTTVRTGGLGFGGGVNVSALAAGAYVEGRYELMDGSRDQWVFRVGLRFW